MNEIKYAIITTDHKYLYENGDLVTFDTYKEAVDVLNSSDTYVKVAQVELEIKPTITNSYNILNGSLLDARLRTLAIVVIQGTEVPQEFKEKFKIVISTNIYTEELDASLKQIQKMNREPILLIIPLFCNTIFNNSDLYLKQNDQFYSVLKFNSTTRYTNKYTIFNLSI